MELPKDGTHSPGCTAVTAYSSGRLRSPWSAAFHIEDAGGATGVYRWYVVPCADPRCSAVRRMVFERPAASVARRAHAAA